MDNTICYECGQPAHHNHHVVPLCKGGTRTVPLCTHCHGLVHGRDFTKMRTLQAVGIAKAKEKGIYKGRKQGTTKGKPEEALALRDKGMTVPEIAEALGISLRTAFRYVATAPPL